VIDVKTLVSAIGAVAFTVALSAGGPGDMPQAKPTQTAPKSTGGQHSTGSDRGSSDRSSRMWWKVPEVMKEIGLTPEQSKTIDALFQKRLPEAMARDTEYKKQQAILDKLLSERTVGSDVIGVQLDRVEALRTTQNKTRTIMFYEMHKVLSAEQYNKLVKYWERTRGRGDSRNK
jgi:Spy/CpxP family protein refolding chaperone